MTELIFEFYKELKLSDNLTAILSLTSLFAAICILSWLSDFITRSYIVRLVNQILKKAHPGWTGYVMQRKVVRKLSHLAPLLVFYIASPLFHLDGFEVTESLSSFVRTVSVVLLILAASISVNSFLLAFEDIYNTYPVAKKRPIKSYLQVLKTVLIFVAGVFAFSVILQKSPWAFFTGLGAATAVIMLVFRDSILGFVASIQLASFDMIRIGDWITMPGFGADGDVLEISLTTVKVRNFDKTITTIPTYALLSAGVKNWRGMSESGGRRIKRSLKIDLKTIKFCDDNLLDKLASEPLLKSFIEEFRQNSRSDIHSANQQLTNCGLYRRYCNEWLLQNKNIHKDGFTFLIRQLEPSETGLPLEIYIFTKSTRWVEYEGIQADIFDHLLASLSFFELEPFQTLSKIRV